MLDVASPWESAGTRKIKARVCSLLVLMVIAFSFAAMWMQSKVYADDLSVCQSVAVIGDSRGVGIKDAEIEKLLNSKGVNNVEIKAKPGVKTVDIASDSDMTSIANGRCVIIESGSDDLSQSSEADKEDINKVVDSLGSASHIYWVAPVASEGSGKDTAKFKTALKGIADNNNKVSVIDLSDMGSNDSYFESNGIDMKNNGYSIRAQKIVDALKLDRPSNGGGNGSGGSGGSGSGIGDRVKSGDVVDAGPGESTADVLNNVEKDKGRTSYSSDNSASSPRKYAEYAAGTTRMAAAIEFLPAVRWNAYPIAEPSFSIIDPGGATHSITATFAKGCTSLASLLWSMMLKFIALMMGSSIATVGFYMSELVLVGLSNGFTGNDTATLGYFLSCIFAAFLIATIYRIFTNIGAMKQILASSAVELAKVLLMFTMILFIIRSTIEDAKTGPRSASVGDAFSRSIFKEGNETSGNSLLKKLSESSMNDGDFSGNLDGLKNETKPGSETIVEEFAGKNALKPSTWTPLSLGWIMSFIYSTCILFVQVVSQIILIILISPILYLTNVVNKDRQDTGEGKARASCARYVDGLHSAFMSSNAASSNVPLANILSALDYLYMNFAELGFQHLYGGSSFASQNSWCWAAEVQNKIPPGQWLMVARAAGLYKEYAGSGNLIRGIPYDLYTNGNHSPLSPDANLDSGLPLFDGIGVKRDGSWNVDNGQLRAKMYMNGMGSVGNIEAIYYFAACKWEPTAEMAVLSQEWGGNATNSAAEQLGRTKKEGQGVLGQGPSANKWGKITFDYGEDVELASGGGQEVYKSLYGKLSSQGWGELPEDKPGFLTSLDCTHPSLFPVQKIEELESDAEDAQAGGDGDSADDIGDDGDGTATSDSSDIFKDFSSIGEIGLGSSSPYAQRWAYAKINPSLLKNFQKYVDSSINRFKGMLPFSGGDDDVEGGGEVDPDSVWYQAESKFGKSEDMYGHNRPEDFFKRMVGEIGMGHGMAALFILVLSILIFVFLLPFILIAMMTNFFILLSAIVIPTILMVKFFLWIAKRIISVFSGTRAGDAQ